MEDEFSFDDGSFDDDEELVIPENLDDYDGLEDIEGLDEIDEAVDAEAEAVVADEE